MLRVARGKDLMDRASWEFFAGLTAAGKPRWSKEQAQTKAALVDPNGVGWVAGVSYVKALGRFLLLTQHRKDHASYMSVFEASNAWGPWKTVAYTRLRHPEGLADPYSFYFALLANGFSADGTGFTLVFNGSRGTSEALNLVDGRFTLNPAER